MTLLALIRHGATDWSEAGRMQGRADRPLSEAGRAEVASWRLPSRLKDCDWATSPLVRARDTALILLGRPARIEPILIEAHWGEWEGCRLAELRAAHGAAMAENEARGLDFRPPGGESPRDLQDRLRPWLAGLARAGRDTAAITHRGVIRAVLGLATGWDFTGKPPCRLEGGTAHLFMLDAQGAPRIERLNLPLAPEPLKPE